MSVSYIPEKVKILLWGKAGGRCQYRGCNASLYRDDLTQAEFSQCYVAHIVADSVGGPRGHITRSEELKKDLKNLMILCDTHHRLIDREKVDEHNEEVLLQMKKEHEDRMDLITGINPNMKSEMIIYKASIGNNPVMMTYDSLKEYLVPEKYPARNIATDLSISNSATVDSRKSFWDLQLENLDDQFKDQILPKLRKSESNHFTLFALAPIPLLGKIALRDNFSQRPARLRRLMGNHRCIRTTFSQQSPLTHSEKEVFNSLFRTTTKPSWTLVKLGVYFNDIQNLDVRQKRRNPDTWNFEDDIITEYHFIPASETKTQVALKFELSDNINDDRVTSVLGDDVSIYSIRVDNPDNDFVKSRKEIQDFGEKMKEAFREIKNIYGQNAVLNIFPAMPVSLAVQLGRVWMPKADLSMKIFDQNYALGGFVEAIEIKHS